MRRLFALAICVVSMAAASAAQMQMQPERRVIEVSGSAERLVTPNEFTFKITLAERMEKKEKITIEQQEALLRTELSKLGIDAGKDLSIFDISSTYFRQKKVRDVLGTKDFRLKIRDLKQIAQLQDLADRINIARLELIDTEHTEITRLRREVKMDAMRAAKDKADYLLGSIGQKAGIPVYIKEEPDATPSYQLSGLSSNSNSTANFIRRTSSVSDDADDDLSFTPIRLRYVIHAKFEIE
jgi:uncharacterized protein